MKESEIEREQRQTRTLLQEKTRYQMRALWRKNLTVQSRQVITNLA
jgi:hypothetical protein